MKAILPRALILPGALALLSVLTGVIWGIASALAVAVAGLTAILGWHFHQLGALERWASGPVDAPVPEGRGVWGLAYDALYRRVRLRSARQRDLRLALDRFVSGAEALPEGVVGRDATDTLEG